MRFTIQDLLRATFAVAFLTACVASQWRGDSHAILILAMLVGAVGIPVAAVRYSKEQSRHYLAAIGILGFLTLVSGLLLITDGSIPFAFGVVLLAFGSPIAVLNFYLSFVRYPFHWLQGGTPEGFRHVSGLPLLGSLMLWIAAALLWNHPLAACTALALSLFDTLGLHWLLGVVIFATCRKRWLWRGASRPG